MAHHNAFIKALSKMPTSTAVGATLGASFIVSALCTVLFSSKGERPHTLSPEWKAATKTYMQFQKMNPINGISRGL